MGIGSQVSQRRAVFLDRDGVINEAVVKDGKPYPPSGLSELKILPGVAEAINHLHQEGWLLIVVTNQPDVARGITKRETVEEINQFLLNQFPFECVLTCYHDTNDKCDCRKPRPGFLLQSQQRYGIDLSASYMVGDRWRDIEAGVSAECKTIFIDYGYNERQPTNYTYRANDLLEASKIIVSNHS